MRYHELVPEAINLTQYSKDVEDAVYSGIRLALENFAKTHGQNTEAEAELEEGHATQFRTFMRQELAKLLPNYIGSQLKQVAKDKMNITPSNVVFQHFKNENTGGHVEQNILVVINILKTNAMAAQLSEQAVEMTFNSYGEGEYANGLYSFIDAVADGDQYYSRVMFDRGSIKDIIDEVVSIFLHEMVHVQQHSRQKHRWMGHGTEYRSYLGKKNEFYNLANQEQSRALGKARSDRFFYLYMASPQEIPAFAHQMALLVIKNMYLDDVDRPEDIWPIDSSDLVYQVKSILGNRYQNPKNPKESKIFKRYLKLVYSEVNHYIEQLKKRLGTPPPI